MSLYYPKLSIIVFCSPIGYIALRCTGNIRKWQKYLGEIFPVNFSQRLNSQTYKPRLRNKVSIVVLNSIIKRYNTKILKEISKYLYYKRQKYPSKIILRSVTKPPCLWNLAKTTLILLLDSLNLWSPHSYIILLLSQFPFFFSFSCNLAFSPLCPASLSQQTNSSPFGIRLVWQEGKGSRLLSIERIPHGESVYPNFARRGAGQKEIFPVRESTAGIVVVVVQPPTSLPRLDCCYFLKRWSEKPPPASFDPCCFLSPGSFSCQVSSYQATMNSNLLGE